MSRNHSIRCLRHDRCRHRPDFSDLLPGRVFGEIAIARDRQRLRRQDADELLQSRCPFANNSVSCGLTGPLFWFAEFISVRGWPCNSPRPFFRFTLRVGFGSATTFQLLALTVQATALCLMPFWGWVSVRIGKKAVYFVGMTLWLLAQVAAVSKAG